MQAPGSWQCYVHCMRPPSLSSASLSCVLQPWCRPVLMLVAVLTMGACRSNQPEMFVGEPSDFVKVTLDHGWEMENGADNAWRRIEVNNAGDAVLSDAWGSQTFRVGEAVLESLRGAINNPRAREALGDTRGEQCGAFVGSTLFFTVEWSSGEAQRASAAGCTRMPDHPYTSIMAAISEVRRQAVECVDRTAADFEDHDSVREGRVRGLCVPCGGTC